MPELRPVAPRDRVVTLDVLRGFALLGVLIGNLFWLYGGRAWEDHPDTRALDGAVRWLVLLLVESKAQTLLTFLFGFGFAAQLLRAQTRHEPILGLYLRRLIVLFTIGALHVTLLWWGDVTWTYAVGGFGLLLFLRVSNRARLVWAALLTFVPFLLWTLPAVRSKLVESVITPNEMARQIHQLLAAIHGPRYLPTLRTHVRFAVAWEGVIFLWYFPWLVGRFLVGYVAGIQRWFEADGAGHLPLFRRLLLYGLGCGVANAAMSIVARSSGLDWERLPVAGQLALNALEQLGIIGMTAAYVAAVVLLMQRPAWRRLLRVLAPVGRMPLTTYVCQSVICTFLFYGWGLGWAGKVGPAACVGLALAIFTLQLAACHLWLRRFRFGPLEWVWRTLVYLRPQPMRA